MKALSKNLILPQRSPTRKNNDEYNLNVTNLFKVNKEKVFATLEAGQGRLEIRTEGVFLIFSSQSDKKNFFSGLC